MATLRDVARLAGVSAMTVSNVINGREGRVSAATVEKVRAAVEEIGYVPNASARSLASCSSRIIALVYGAVPGRDEDVVGPTGRGGDRRLPPGGDHRG